MALNGNQWQSPGRPSLLGILLDIHRKLISRNHLEEGLIYLQATVEHVTAIL